MLEYIKINNKDNVAVALTDLDKDYVINIDGEEIILKEPIRRGHKFTLKNMNEGDKVIKYGMLIGILTKDVENGCLIHTSNIKTSLGDILNYEYNPELINFEKQESSYFYGYQRKNGKVGIRNDIWIIPTVGCVNAVCKQLELDFNTKINNPDLRAIAFPHPYGCSQMGDDQENTRKALADMILHQNAGAVLVLGLGCENTSIDILKDYIGEYDKERVVFLSCQEYDDEYTKSLEVLDSLYNFIKDEQRVKTDVSKLVVGLKCGGSDGLSGITANPLVGEFSDILISKGGSTILTEVPEMFGAETNLMNRCESKQVFNKTVSLINDFKMYYKNYNMPIYENPSPGNKEGGISTLEDKSNGCIQKSGTANIVDVLDYGERIEKQGLNLLSAPGNDLVSSTALALSGAHIVLFTTGRGTPFSCPVPTIKISSNTNLYNRKKNWIDFNAGLIVEDTDKKTLAKELFDFVLKISSGEKTRSEKMNSYDWAIFKKGVTL